MLTWDEDKRRRNLSKHGLDFADVDDVLTSRFRLDVPIKRGGEWRTQSLSYVIACLKVLTVIHTRRDNRIRIISYRPASEVETEIYREWLENEFDDA